MVYGYKTQISKDRRGERTTYRRLQKLQLSSVPVNLPNLFLDRPLPHSEVRSSPRGSAAVPTQPYREPKFRRLIRLTSRSVGSFFGNTSRPPVVGGMEVTAVQGDRSPRTLTRTLVPLTFRHFWLPYRCSPGSLPLGSFALHVFGIMHTLIAMLISSSEQNIRGTSEEVTQSKRAIVRHGGSWVHKRTRLQPTFVLIGPRRVGHTLIY